MSTPAPAAHAPPLHWIAARRLIETFFALFGMPEAIAAQYRHRENERALLLKWLRAGEAMMRHLLLIAAAHCAKPDVRLRQPNRRTRARQVAAFEIDKPEAWRVSFHCLHRAKKPTRAQRGKRKRPSADERWLAAQWPRPKFYRAWPLALRAEAMLRAFNDPQAFARRVARRLHVAPSRAAGLMRHPPNLPNVIDDFPLLREHAEAARRRFESG